MSETWKDIEGLEEIKLTDKEVRHIKLLIEESTLTESHIGEMFGVTRDVVSKIKQGKI